MALRDFNIDEVDHGSIGGLDGYQLNAGSLLTMYTILMITRLASLQSLATHTSRIKRAVHDGDLVSA